MTCLSSRRWSVVPDVMASRHMEIFTMVDEQDTMDFNQIEITNCRVTVSVVLSDSAHIPAIRQQLGKSLPDCDCEVQGKTITVSGYPPSDDFDASHILELIKKHDLGATKA
ncbi:uncharacterized protein [Physcomitrium patens]|uniref:uncharacterized protein isoform X1 n=1 Tax=Physcomitrium patens TaxID=3218 RepID=UPI000D1787A9|nr:uncharacterized protein LOC112295923 isoform X1 [Physcomitrium patens]|eukprot:XP_024403740.1 uncharacterized protein LOC112295923 isoform X1 [Physcomitrella patens]